MKYSQERTKSFNKTLKKLYKKDQKRFMITLTKISEILKNPHRYKNLKYSMKEFKRAHIDSHFVLVFKINEHTKTVKFMDLEHHDTIYER